MSVFDDGTRCQKEMRVNQIPDQGEPNKKKVLRIKS